MPEEATMETRTFVHEAGDVRVTIEMPADLPDPRTVHVAWSPDSPEEFAELAAATGGIERYELPEQVESFSQAAWRHVEREDGGEGDMRMSIEEPPRANFGPLAEQLAANMDAGVKPQPKAEDRAAVREAAEAYREAQGQAEEGVPEDG
jgi:hypothetical protein